MAPNLDLRLSPAERGPDWMCEWLGDTTPNKHGIVPLQYEITPNGMKTGWRKYRCGCGTEYYAQKPLSQTASCGKCRTRGTTTTLELIGNRYGALEVTGHERGRGWVVRCDCGRAKYIVNGTQLVNGMHQTCGQCKYEERFEGSLSRMKAEGWVVAGDPPTPLITRHRERGAPHSSFQDEFVADNEKALKQLLRVDKFCDSDHPLIGYRRSENEEAGGCPLCMAMARIEMLEADAEPNQQCGGCGFVACRCLPPPDPYRAQ